MLEQKKHQSVLADFLIVPEFGLDVAVFVKQHRFSVVQFLELKSFNRQRPGGMGFGDSKGGGPQVDLLISDDAIRLTEKSVRWVFVDETREEGSKRFAVLTSDQAKKSAMNGVRRGKQNNFNIRTSMENAITWDELSTALETFLTTS